MSLHSKGSIDPQYLELHTKTAVVLDMNSYRELTELLEHRRIAAIAALKTGASETLTKVAKQTVDYCDHKIKLLLAI